MPFILEGILTTLNLEGTVNLAPMGPIVLGDQEPVKKLLFRPFQDSQTFKNLQTTGEGVFHLTDDVSIFVAAVTRTLNLNQISMKDSTSVHGKILSDACKCYEVRITDFDTSSVRAELQADVVSQKTMRDFCGFNRAKHAVLELTIMATRLHLLEAKIISREMARVESIVEKTAGPKEADAFNLLKDFIARYSSEQKSASSSKQVESTTEEEIQ